MKAAPPPPGLAGSRTRSPPIARHSSRETYRPESAAAVGGRIAAALEAGEQPIAVRVRDPGPAVADGQPHATPRLIDSDDGSDRRAATVLDRVVEERPEHLVELVRVGDGEPTTGSVVEVEVDVVDAERLPGLADARPERQRPRFVA